VSSSYINSNWLREGLFSNPTKPPSRAPGALANQLKEQDHASSGKTTLFNAKKWRQPSWNMREKLLIL
jgi:hypothetical protein